METDTNQQEPQIQKIQSKLQISANDVKIAQWY